MTASVQENNQNTQDVKDDCFLIFRRQNNVGIMGSRHGGDTGVFNFCVHGTPARGLEAEWP